MKDQWISFKMAQQRIRFPKGMIGRLFIGERKLTGKVKVQFVLAWIPVRMTKPEIKSETSPSRDMWPDRVEDWPTRAAPRFNLGRRILASIGRFETGPRRKPSQLVTARSHRQID